MTVDDMILRRKMARITLLAMDIDGTFTDGILYYDSHGEVIKGFSASDGMGLELLRRAGLRWGFITGRHDNASETRARYLGCDFFESGVGDKGVVLTRIIEEHGLKPEETMFVGDDLNDLTAFDVAGVSIAVANASDEAKSYADVVTKRSGGQGAIREVVMMLLHARGLDPVALWMSDSDNPVGKQ